MPTENSDQPAHPRSLISLRRALWVAKDPKCLQSDSKDTDQISMTIRALLMCKLISPLAVQICSKDPFCVARSMLNHEFRGILNLFFSMPECEPFSFVFYWWYAFTKKTCFIIQSTLVISTSLTSNNRLSRSENLVPFKHENLTTDKILWKREEIALKEQFLLFSTIFSIYIYLTSGVKLHIHLWNVVVPSIFLLNSANLICRSSDISKYFRESLGVRDNESRLYMQIYCMFMCCTNTPRQEQEQITLYICIVV